MNQSIVNSNKNLQSLTVSVSEIQKTAQAGAKALGLNQKATTQQTQATVKNTQATQKQVQNISALDRATNFIIRPFNAIAKGANRADQAIDRAFNRTLAQNTKVVGNGLRQFGQRIKDNITSLTQFAGKLKTSLAGLRGASAAAVAGGVGGTPAVNKKIQAKLDKAAGKKGGGSRGTGDRDWETVLEK